MHPLIKFGAPLASALLMSDLAVAEETAQYAEDLWEAERASDVSPFSAASLAAGFGIAIATLGTGIGQGYIVGKAVEGIARQPESANKVQTVMIIGLAFVESLAIYALLIALILLFRNPFLAYITG